MNYKPYKTLLKRENHIRNLKANGFKFIHKKNKFKIVCGIICISIAIIPNGTGLILYPLGFLLLGFNKMDFYRYKEIALRKLKSKRKMRYKLKC